jgi:hypothetical protein
VKIFQGLPELKGVKVMEFIKTHWSRLSLALLFLLGGIVAIVCYLVGDAFNATAMSTTTDTIGTILPFVSALVFFFGMAAVMLFKAFDKTKYVGIFYGVIGGLVTLANVIVMCIYNVMSVNGFWTIIVPLIVFGLHPLLKGLTKFVENNNWTPKVKAVEAAPKADAEETAVKKTATK